MEDHIVAGLSDNAFFTLSFQDDRFGWGPVSKLYFVNIFEDYNHYMFLPESAIVPPSLVR